MANRVASLTDDVLDGLMLLVDLANATSVHDALSYSLEDISEQSRTNLTKLRKARQWVRTMSALRSDN